MALTLHTWCWYCKQEIPPKSEACPFCSKPLDSSKKVVRCPKCGKYLLSSAERCVQCGLPLRETEHRPGPAQQPQRPPQQSAGAPDASALRPGRGAAPPQPPQGAGGLDASALKPSKGAAPAPAPAPDASSLMPNNGGEPQPYEPPAVTDAPDAAPEQGGAEQTPPLPDDPDMQETLRTLEQLEAQERYEAQERSTRKIAWVAIAITVVALAALAVVFLLTRPGAKKPAEPEGPVYCADGEHEWVEADCTHPRTCAKCGKTEGEALGHHYVDNVCEVCGAYKKPFYFTGADCEREGSTVIFWGEVKNYTGVVVRELQVRLDLYDKDMNQVATETANVLTDGVLVPLEERRWEMRYDDTEVKWKYWRVSAVDFSSDELTPEP